MHGSDAAVRHAGICSNESDAGGEQEQIQNDPSGDAAGHKDPHHFQKRKRFHTIPPVE